MSRNQLHIECEMMTRPVSDTKSDLFFLCWQKRDGSFTWKSLWRMRNECLCPAASWRCYDCDVKAIKEILQFSLNNLTRGKIKEPFGVNIRQNWASSVTRLLWFVRDRSEYLSLSDSLIISRHTVHNLVRYRSTCNDTLRFQADLNWTCHDQNLVFLHFFYDKSVTGINQLFPAFSFQILIQKRGRNTNTDTLASANLALLPPVSSF